MKTKPVDAALYKALGSAVVEQSAAALNLAEDGASPEAAVTLVGVPDEQRPALAEAIRQRVAGEEVVVPDGPMIDKIRAAAIRDLAH